jgi:hypothetical protein
LRLPWAKREVTNRLSNNENPAQEEREFLLVVPPKGRVPNHIFPKIRGKYSTKGLTVRNLIENWGIVKQSECLQTKYRYTNSDYWWKSLFA